jgi:hypothetical protein
MVCNLHARRFTVGGGEVGALLDSLSGDDDRLWPRSWPAMRFDRPLEVGAFGGHGPIRYHVESYLPGRSVRFRFSAPRGFDGYHEFSVVCSSPGSVELRHLMVVRLRSIAWLSYPLVWRPMHDALIEDCLDRAERALTGTVAEPTRWSLAVRLLRSLAGRLDRTRARNQ